MIMMDHKKAIMTMMAKRNPKDGSMSAAPMKPEIIKNEDGSMDGRHAAAEDIIMAMKEGSAEKMKQAMMNFHDLHVAARDQGTDEPEAE